MDTSEPSFVPQWLKNSGSSNGGGSIPHSDDRSTSGIARNKSFATSNGRSSSSERSTSSYFRRSSSSNGSRSYSNFGGRNRRDKEWQKDTYDYQDKDKLIFGDGRHREVSEPPVKTLSSKFEMNGSRRSQSLITGKDDDIWPRKVVTDSRLHSGNKVNGFLNKGSPVGGVKKETIEADFPLLGAEDRKLVPEVVRIPSPSLTSSFQSLPIGTSTGIGGDRWTSALAEVPILVGSNGIATSSLQQSAPSSPSSVTIGTTTGLNMAETVAQGPSRVPTAPQLSVGSQRLEELAIKQSRQLIPVTPSLPKTLATSSSDKLRPKAGLLQHPVSSPLPLVHSPRAAPVKGEASKLSTGGKLQILKPVREKNGVTSAVKDSSTSTNGNKVVSSTVATALPVSGSTGARAPLTVLEKRPTSQAKSRNDFFNLVRKKSLANSSSVTDSVTENSPSAAGAKISSGFPDKLNEREADLAPGTPRSANNPLNTDLGVQLSEMDVACIGDAEKNGCNVKKHSSIVFPEEEEAALLRSWGWEENADEDGLTEEEITAFYKEVANKFNSKPSLKILLQGVQLKCQLPFESQMGAAAMGGVTSGLSSSNAKLES